jgi:predicted DNA-binding transcriptional regulator YafY
MLPFKPSVHRIYFIDKQVRENAYPTSVSLASGYREKYGVSVDPRTIAADIAAMKEAYGAPLSYDHQKRGYFYTNPNFRLPVLKDDGEEPIPVIAQELHPRTAGLPEWQRGFIASLADKVLPLPKGSGKKATVLLNTPEAFEKNDVREPLLAALEHNAAVHLSYIGMGKKQTAFLFRPLHIICTLGDNLIFGLARIGNEERYKLLYMERIMGAELHDAHGTPAPYVHIQTTGNRDIEAVISGESSDLLLVFSLPASGQNGKFAPEYSLLVQTEIFAQG